MNFFQNEIAQAAQKQEDQSAEDGLIFASTVNKDPRWQNNPSRWDAAQLNLHTARAVRHEEIRLGRALTPAEQKAHIRKLLDAAAAKEKEQQQ